MIEVACALLIAISAYMLLEPSLHRKVLGIALLSTALNITLLYSGRLVKNQPAFSKGFDYAHLANPVPQALILTAIVIGLGLLIFLCVLIKVCNSQ